MSALVRNTPVSPNTKKDCAIGSHPLLLRLPLLLRRGGGGGGINLLPVSLTVV